MEIKRNLLVLGPYDRYNYGDLLFPIIIEKELEGTYESIYIYSTTMSDLSSVGGKKTQDISELYKFEKREDERNLLVIAGGESLFTSWGTLCSYIYPEFKKCILFSRVLNKIFGPSSSFRFLNYVGRRKMRGKTFLPLSVSLSELPNMDSICFNSLGGSWATEDIMHSSKNFIRVFNDINYLAVRDEKTFNLLNENNIDVSLVPDSAILMSKFFSKDFLRENISDKVKQFVEITPNYLFFQVNRYHGVRNLQEIKKQLDKISRDLKFPICLCPIGMALGHQDYDALSEIQKILNVETCLFTEDISIWDIMFLIANSRLYIGTSLHGIITAMSYEVPYIGLVVKKLDCYLQKWGISGLDKTCLFEDIYEVAQRVLIIDRTLLLENLMMQKTKVEESFNKIKETIQ